MNQALENATIVATFIGGISGLWFLWDKCARVVRKYARSKQGSGVPLPRPRRSITLTSFFTLALGASLATFFASSVSNVSWYIAYVGVAAIGGALSLSEAADTSSTWRGSGRIAPGLFGATLSSLYAACSGIILLPHATEALARYLSDEPIVFPRYVAPLIGAIAGLAGGFCSSLVSRDMRFSSMLPRAIVMSVFLAFMFSVITATQHTMHKVGGALFFLISAIGLMFCPLLLPDD